VIAADLDLDLEIFTGPFDLLLTLVLREEVDLLEVELSGIVLAYLDVLEERGERLAVVTRLVSDPARAKRHAQLIDAHR
jgi:chromatin segregation and condensation protein Rec8/ScpA/Scc1 (kleisin family)